MPNIFLLCLSSDQPNADIPVVNVTCRTDLLGPEVRLVGQLPLPEGTLRIYVLREGEL